MFGDNNMLTFAANATSKHRGGDDHGAAQPRGRARSRLVKVSGSVAPADATAKSPAEVTLTITDDDDVPGLPRAFNVAAGDDCSGADVAEAERI